MTRTIEKIGVTIELYDETEGRRTVQFAVDLPLPDAPLTLAVVAAWRAHDAEIAALVKPPPP